MPNSYAVYTGNGATTQFTVPFPYIRREHVVVSVNYVSTAFTWVNNTTVQVSPAPANASRVEVRRVTPVNAPLVDFTDGSTLVAADLDTNYLQQTYVNQEQDDQIQQGIFVDANGNLTAGNQVLKNLLDPVDPQDAATKTYVDTNDALKLNKAGDTMTGALAMGNNKVTGLGTPSAGGDATNKTYVDTNDALKLNKAGDTMTGALAMSSQKITGLGAPTASGDATTKGYVDTWFSTYGTSYYGALAADPVTDPLGGAMTSGDLYFNTATNRLRVYNGTTWSDSGAPSQWKRWKKTAAGGETTLSGTDDGTETLSYVPGQEYVFINGALQTRGVDYEGITGTTITNLVALTAGDVIEVHSLEGYSVGTVMDGSITNIKVDDGAGIASTKLAFTQAGAGAVPRTVDSKLKDVVSVKDFGAVGDGVADDTAAIQAAINSIPGGKGATIYFPGGYYKTTSTVTVQKDLIYFLGDGARASVIRVHHNTGPGVEVKHVSSPGSTYVSGFGMSDMMIRAFTETTANSALLLNKVQSVTLHNVHLEDHYGGLHILGGNNHYCTNLNIRSARTTAPVSWSAPKAGSFFLKIDRSSDNQVPFEMYVSNFNFRWENAAYIENGIEINCVDGIWLSNGHIMGCSNANMKVEPVDGSEQITGIRADNVWFDDNTPYGLYITGASSSQFGVIELCGSRFLTPSTAAIWVDASAIGFGGLVMNGGVIHKSAGFGVMIREGRQSIFNGVEFAACNTLGIANTAGLSIQNANDNVIVSNCQFTNVQDVTTASAMQGIRISAEATSQVTVTGCNFNLNAAALDISDASTLDANNYSNNTTTKSPNITSVTSSVLDVPEIGDVFYVSNGLTFNNIAGRWGGRQITLVFAGIVTVTHSVGGIRLSGGVNFVSKNGDTLTLAYLTSINDWIEVGRMVS